jgi:hypothetical protein
MRLSAVFTVMVVVGSTPASAQLKQEENSGRVRLDDDDKPAAVRQDGEWVVLVTPTPAKHGTEFALVDKTAGSFSKLRVSAEKGKTIVVRLKVYFDDGQTKTVQLDKALPEGKSTFVDLGGEKKIDRIVVTTETYTRGQYAVYGSSGVGPAVGDR